MSALRWRFPSGSFSPFLLYRKVRPIQQKNSAQNAHLADLKIVATQHRSGAKESQATLSFFFALKILEESFLRKP
jgi:hypothetical protein